MVPHFAWGLTLRYSDDEGAKAQADKIKNDLEEIKRAVYNKEKLASEKYNDPSNKNSQKIEENFILAQKNKVFFESVNAAINSCERTLLTIIRGRNLNFKEADALMATQKANIESSERVMLNLQSALPRLFATGGGAAGTVVAKYALESIFNVEIPDEVLYSFAVIVAGIVYGFYQLFIGPKNSLKIMKERVCTDYRRNLYYRQYVSRACDALKSLFSRTLEIYEDVYENKYNKDYDFEENRKAVITTTMGGEVALCGNLCPKIHKHYHENKIGPLVWSTCESAIGYEKCSLWNDK